MFSFSLFNESTSLLKSQEGTCILYPWDFPCDFLQQSSSAVLHLATWSGSFFGHFSPLTHFSFFFFPFLWTMVLLAQITYFLLKLIISKTYLWIRYETLDRALRHGVLHSDSNCNLKSASIWKYVLGWAMF